MFLVHIRFWIQKRSWGHAQQISPNSLVFVNEKAGRIFVLPFPADAIFIKCEQRQVKFVGISKILCEYYESDMFHVSALKFSDLTLKAFFFWTSRRGRIWAFFMPLKRMKMFHFYGSFPVKRNAGQIFYEFSLKNYEGSWGKVQKQLINDSGGTLAVQKSYPFGTFTRKSNCLFNPLLCKIPQEVLASFISD